MSESLKPSDVLEQYNIIGRDVSTHLVSRMRRMFKTMEEAGETPVCILQDAMSGLSPSKKVDADRIYVIQACAEVLGIELEPVEETTNEYDAFIDSTTGVKK